VWGLTCCKLVSIFLLQVSDAYRMDPPLDIEMDENGLRWRGRWSHDYRPLPYDGGYLPLTELTRAVLGTGFRGWMSIESLMGRRRRNRATWEYLRIKLWRVWKDCCRKLVLDYIHNPIEGLGIKSLRIMLHSLDLPVRAILRLFTNCLYRI